MFGFGRKKQNKVGSTRPGQGQSGEQQRVLRSVDDLVQRGPDGQPTARKVSRPLTPPPGATGSSDNKKP